MAGKKRDSTSLVDTSPVAKKAKTDSAPAAPEPTRKLRKSTSTRSINADVPKPSTKPVKTDKSQAKSKIVKKSEPAPESESEAESEEAAQDELATILAGFSGSESDSEPEDEGIDVAVLPAIPDVAVPAPKKGDEPGVCYIGRIPRGFYERQMRAYFSQFGVVSRLRLARNKRTGKYQHHAWIEFAAADVADIVAKAMDKYLMFGHILQVKRIPASEVHPELFKGAGKRFKAVPRNKMEGKALSRGAEKKVWDGRVENEIKQRAKSAKKAGEMGYEYVGATLKKTDGTEATETSAADQEKASTPVKRNKTGKGNKAKKARV